MSPYCSLPHQVDEWFKAFLKAEEMCGPPGTTKRIPPEKEVRYLDALVRGVYAKETIKPGGMLLHDNVYLAVPLLKGQISCRELMIGEIVVGGVEADKPIMFEMIDSPYAYDSKLSALIRQRGLDL